MPTHDFIHVDSAWCLAHGKFKFCFLTLSGIFFPQNIFDPWLVESIDVEPEVTEGQLYSKLLNYYYTLFSPSPV